MKKRPAIDFMERVQKDINASMRAILIDWLVEVIFFYLDNLLAYVSLVSSVHALRGMSCLNSE